MVLERRIAAEQFIEAFDLQTRSGDAWFDWNIFSWVILLIGEQLSLQTSNVRKWYRSYIIVWVGCERLHAVWRPHINSFASTGIELHFFFVCLRQNAWISRAHCFILLECASQVSTIDLKQINLLFGLKGFNVFGERSSFFSLRYLRLCF